jgi:hypothetical protein
MAPLAPMIGIPGCGGNQQLAKRGKNASQQIEKDKFYMSQRAFDVIAKYPEIEHVSGKVPKSAVDKERCDERKKQSVDSILKQLVDNHPVCHYKLIMEIAWQKGLI